MISPNKGGVLKWRSKRESEEEGGLRGIS